MLLINKVEIAKLCLTFARSPSVSDLARNFLIYLHLESWESTRGSSLKALET